jgi:hypothetical protein
MSNRGRPISWKVTSFTQARRLARSVGFKSIRDYRRRCREYGLPPSPSYSFPQFKNWQDFINIPPRSRAKQFVSYDRAVALVREHGVTSQSEYNTFRRTEPNIGIPWVPQKVYKNRGWKDWDSLTGSSHGNNETRRRRKGIKCHNHRHRK